MLMLKKTIKSYFERLCGQNSKILALDINGSQVKFLLVTHNKGGIQIEATAIEPIIDNRIDAAIQKAWLKLPTPPKKIKIALPSAYIFHKVLLQKPSLTDFELEKKLTLNLEGDLPYESEELNFDFKILEKDPQKVLIAACQKKHIQQTLQFCMAADLQVSVVDVECYAIARVVNFIFNKFKKTDSRIVFHLAPKFITLLSAQYPWFCQTETVVNQESAEIINSCQRLMQHYKSNHQSQIQAVYLTGEIPTGFEDLLAEKLEAKIQILNPFLDLPLPSQFELAKVLGSQFVTCFGLALRGLEQL